MAKQMTKQMTKNMTEGNPLRLILLFSLPMIAGNLLQQMYNMVDGIIVGRALGAEALASVGATSSVQFLIIGFCTGTCSGFAIPLAQSFGAGDHRGLKRFVWNTWFLTAMMAVIITALCVIFCPTILHLLSTPDEIYQNAYSYLVILFIGIPCTLLYNMLAGMLRAVGDSRTPFLFLVFSTCLNIVLDLLFIIVFGWGCAGAARATIMSQGVSGLLCLRLLLKRYDILKPGSEERKIQGNYVRKLLFTGIPMGLQYSVTAIGSMMMQVADNRLGTVFISGYASGFKIKHLFMCPMDAMGTATAMYVGQNLGANRMDRIRKGMLQMTGTVALYGVFCGLIMYFFGYSISSLFVSSDNVEVLAASAMYAKYVGMFMWTVGILIVIRYSVQGMGYSAITVVGGGLELVARGMVSFLAVPVYGYLAVCFTDQVAWAVAMVYIIVIGIWCFRHVKRRMELSK